jgi:hypothetical protein
LQGLASYTFSHSIDIASTDAANNRSTPGTIASPNIDRGNYDFDIRHSFTAGVTYDLPSPGLSKTAHVIFAGWSWTLSFWRDLRHQSTLLAQSISHH